MAGRDDVVAHRLAAQHLDRRLPSSAWRRAVVGGLQDSAPRSAVLALYARVSGVGPDAWADPGLVQVWGPRGAVYVVPAEDVAVFTLGLLPRDDGRHAEAERAADALEAAFGPDPVRKRDAFEALDRRVDRLVLAGTTGRIRLRWDGRDTLVRMVPAPPVDPETARAELLRRFLDVLGPATPAGFAAWTGLPPGEARTTWDALAGELQPLTVAGEPRAVRQAPLASSARPHGVRLLPPGDPFLLAPDRAVLVPDADRRAAIWPLGTVQPGALLVDGELVGTWRRRGHRVAITTLGDVPDSTRPAAEAEAAGFPLGLDREIAVRWDQRA